ncbi:histidine--tRNA ligase [Defluviicoccus vanus]|uniref:Histidine--tRNA ligase n=1 Tax=Defluviicoccus vanus TaxID=111831 RepID=A0A7H1N161_9PROT|nr:histidine--tRNA ligase [Defluviicoccus vanus]QNT69447.1 histidine--tRNA ligase [Defluviicoccus vanus]
MPDLRPVRGTRDFLPEDSRLRRHVETTAEQVAAACGYGEVATPIFEFTEVFARTLGDTSDVVTKEMYTFADRGGETITLRPENTAGIVRAFISNKLTQQLPLRAFYRGPMFRYERPQKGRLRQFHQVGVELLGVADPLGDVEVIALAYEFLAALGLTETTALELNSLGDGESRTAYRAVLVEYLRQHHGALSEDSRVRLERNPLRILDSKDEGDRRIVAKAPLLVDHLNEASRTVFARTLAGLEALAIPYTHNPRLVRGLDYYCHTAFEFTTQALGAQGTVLAGGRYDGLVQQMGGPATPGTGWAAGVERLMDLVVAPAPAPRPVVVIALGAEQQLPVMTLAKRLRVPGQVVLFAFGGNLGKQMKWTNRVNARRAVIIGSEELARHVATVRDMDTGTQEEVSLAYLDEHLALLA